MVLVTTAGEVGTEAALLLSRQDVPVILVSPAVPAQELGVPASSRS